MTPSCTTKSVKSMSARCTGLTTTGGQPGTTTVVDAGARAGCGDGWAHPDSTAAATSTAVPMPSRPAWVTSAPYDAPWR